MIGTAGTIASGAYESCHQGRCDRGASPGNRAPSCSVGRRRMFEHPAAELIARDTWNRSRARRWTCRSRMHALSLAQADAARVMGTEVKLVDSAEETATVVARELGPVDLRRTAGVTTIARRVPTTSSIFGKLGQLFWARSSSR